MFLALPLLPLLPSPSQSPPLPLPAALRLRLERVVSGAGIHSGVLSSLGACGTAAAPLPRKTDGKGTPLIGSKLWKEK